LYSIRRILSWYLLIVLTCGSVKNLGTSRWYYNDNFKRIPYNTHLMIASYQVVQQHSTVARDSHQPYPSITNPWIGLKERFFDLGQYLAPPWRKRNSMTQSTLCREPYESWNQSFVSRYVLNLQILYKSNIPEGWFREVMRNYQQ
jgi:hypothetical protein